MMILIFFAIGFVAGIGFVVWLLTGDKEDKEIKRPLT